MADGVKFDWKYSILTEIEIRLNQDEIDGLKFLCKDKLNGELAEPLLEHIMMQFHERKFFVQFLFEIFTVLQRPDLLKLIEADTDLPNETEIYEYQFLSIFRVLLTNIWKKTSKNDFESIRFMAKDFILPKSHRSVRNMRVLLDILESKGLLKYDKMEVLEFIIDDNKRLQRLISAYKEETSRECNQYYRISKEMQSEENLAICRDEIISKPTTSENNPMFKFNEQTGHSPATKIARSQRKMKHEYQLNSATCSNSVKYTEPCSYRMTSRPRGYCLIISNETFMQATHGDFQDYELSERQGSEHDIYNLTQTFRDLDFVIDVRTELTGTEI